MYKDNDNSGVVIGKRHAQCDSTGCGVRFVVESTGQHVEVEGGGCTGKVCKVGEAVLSDKALSDPKKRDFINKTNAEILDDINKRAGAGTINKPVKRLKGGETVITVKASQDPTKRTYKNVSDREAASMINQAGGGVALAKGGFVLGEKKFSEISIDELTDYIAFEYHQEASGLVIKGESYMIMGKNEFYLWLYDEKNPAKRINRKEYDCLYFEKFLSEEDITALLDYIWTKKYQETKKGSEHLLGIVNGKYDKESKTIVINYMTVKPIMRRNGIMASMTKWLKNYFNTDNIQMKRPSDENDRFMVGGNYAVGGDLPKFMFDIKFVTWELSTDGSTKSLRIIYDPDIAIDILTLRNGYLDSDWIRTDMFEQEPYKEDSKYNLFKLRDFIVDNLSNKTLDAYRREGLKYNLLKYLELDKSTVSFRLNREMIEGGEAANLTLKEIAEITGEPIDDIIEQVLLGIDEEKEHSPDIYTRKEIAKDHIIKSPYYYEYLPDVEEKGKVKKSIDEYTEPEIKQLVAANDESLDNREAEIAGLLQEKFAAGGCICSMMAEGGSLYDEYYYNFELKKIYDEYNPILQELEVLTPKWNELIKERDEKIKELKNRVRKYYTSQGKYISFIGDSLMVRSLSYSLSKEMKVADGGAITAAPEQEFEFTNIVPIDSKIPSLIEDTKLILHKDEEISKLLGKDFVLKGTMSHNLDKLVKVPFESVVHVVKLERPTFREDQETFHRAYSLTLIDDLNNLYIVHYKSEDDFFDDFMPLTREYYQNRVINFLKSLGIVYNNEKFKVWLRSFEKSAHDIYDFSIDQLKQIFTHLHNQSLVTLNELFTIKSNSIIDSRKFAAGGDIPANVSADPNINTAEFFKEGEKNIRYKDFLFTTIKIQGKKILAVDMPSLQKLTEAQQREYFKVMKAVKNVDFTNAEIYKRPTPFEFEISDDVAYLKTEFSLVELTLQSMMKERGIEWERDRNAEGGIKNVYKFYNQSDYLFFKNMYNWLYTSKESNKPSWIFIDNGKLLHNITLGLIAWLIDFGYSYEVTSENSYTLSFNSMKDYNSAMELYKQATSKNITTDLASGNKLFVPEKYYKNLLDYVSAEQIKVEVLPKDDDAVGDVFKFENANDYLNAAKKYIGIIKTFKEGEMVFEFKENPTDADVIEWIKQYGGNDEFLQSLSKFAKKYELSTKQIYYARRNYRKEHELQHLEQSIEGIVQQEDLNEIEIHRASNPEEKIMIHVGDEIKFSYRKSRYADWESFNAVIKKINKTIIGIQKTGSDKIVYVPIYLITYNKKFKTLIITSHKLITEHGLDK